MFLQVTYDTSQFFFDTNVIHKIITGLTSVSNWWHYLPNVYILETSKTEHEIANEIISELGGLRFLVTKIDINSPNGVLTKEAWEWFSKRNNKKQSFSKVKDTSYLNFAKSLIENQKNSDNPIVRALELQSSNNKNLKNIFKNEEEHKLLMEILKKRLNED